MRKPLLLLALAASVCAVAQQRLLGGDISMLPSYEESKAVYRDSEGKAVKPLEMFSQLGWNAMRVRLFVDPGLAPADHKDEGVCQDIGYVKRLGARIKRAGFRFMLDFHYSDTWADPGKQFMPARWSGVPRTALPDSVYAYTRASLEALVGAGAAPDLIQVGNEISNGMMWPEAKTSPFDDANQQLFGSLLAAGCRACRDVCPEAKIIIHTEKAGDWAFTKAFYDRLATLDYDVIGLSYYPMWHKAVGVLSATLDSLAVRCRDGCLLLSRQRPLGSLARPICRVLSHQHRRAAHVHTRTGGRIAPPCQCHRTVLVVSRGERKLRQYDGQLDQPRTL